MGLEIRQELWRYILQSVIIWMVNTGLWMRSSREYEWRKIPDFSGFYRGWERRDQAHTHTILSNCFAVNKKN